MRDGLAREFPDAGRASASWLTLQLPYGLRSQASTLAPDYFVPMLVGVAIQPVAAAFLVLSAVVSSRARFIPREAA